MEFTMEAFKEKYADQYGVKEFINFDPACKHPEHRLARAVKMIGAVLESMETSCRHDWIKHNNAMRRAARMFGIKTTKELKEALKGAQ